MGPVIRIESWKPSILFPVVMDCLSAVSATDHMLRTGHIL